MDLQARNVIIDVHGHCRITNFGMATHVDYDCEGRNVQIGSMLSSISLYTPPELRSPGELFNHTVDIWALGVLLSELLVGTVRSAVSL